MAPILTVQERESLQCKLESENPLYAWLTSVHLSTDVVSTQIQDSSIELTYSSAKLWEKNKQK